VCGQEAVKNPGACALLAIGVMVTYPLFFEGTNAAFVRGGLSDAEARLLLVRWET